MGDISRTEVAWYEVRADCYGGDSGDVVTPVWHGFHDGDMQDDEFREPLEIKLDRYPIGTTVVVSIPECENCEEEADFATDGKCSCGFDWNKWILDIYS